MTNRILKNDHYTMKYFDLSDFWAIIRGLRKDETKRFEDDFVSYIGVKYAIGTSYGRTALYLGLKAVGAENSEIIVPAFTCTVVRHAIVLAGAKPVFVDINWEKLTLDLEHLKKLLTQKTKAVILTHYFGKVAGNIEDVLDIIKREKLLLIEDCAHSMGASFKGKKVGSFGDFAIFSLTKNTINFGGGVLVTSNPSIYKNAQNILKNEQISWKKRVVDYPIILSYGVDQIINKVLLDRIKRSVLGWWIAILPRAILEIRKFIICIFRLPLFLKKGKHLTRKQTFQTVRQNTTNSYEQGMHMESIIASLGRNQLKKLDELNNQRRNVIDKLSKLKNNHIDRYKKFPNRDVCTNMIMRFSTNDIFNVIDRFKKKGVLLHPTWPTHQALWDGQKTKNVMLLKDRIATWNVNPMLKEKEKRRFITVAESNLKKETKYIHIGKK
jgi:dTDP-4-amino-4,6-dideoxygalactose transaminase